MAAIPMSNPDLDELFEELQELAPPEKKGGRSAREERIIAGFEEIQRFVEMHGYPPLPLIEKDDRDDHEDRDQDVDDKIRDALAALGRGRTEPSECRAKLAAWFSDATTAVAINTAAGTAAGRSSELGGQAPALRALNVTIERGEIFGLLGPNGSGKTTTIKLLLGLLFPTDGEAFLVALKEFHRRPCLYPQFGEPLVELKQEAGQVWIGVVRPHA